LGIGALVGRAIAPSGFFGAGLRLRRTRDVRVTPRAGVQGRRVANASAGAQTQPVSLAAKPSRQGGPLSPLLSNIVLDEFDWKLAPAPRAQGRRAHRRVLDTSVHTTEGIG
jgi:hypothetical protein